MKIFTWMILVPSNGFFGGDSMSHKVVTSLTNTFECGIKSSRMVRVFSGFILVLLAKSQIWLSSMQNGRGEWIWPLQHDPSIPTASIETTNVG